MSHLTPIEIADIPPRGGSAGAPAVIREFVASGAEAARYAAGSAYPHAEDEYPQVAQNLRNAAKRLGAPVKVSLRDGGIYLARTDVQP